MVGWWKVVVPLWAFGLSNALRQNKENNAGLSGGNGGFFESLLELGGISLGALGSAAVSFMPPQFRSVAGGALNMLESETLRKQGIVPVLGGGEDYHWICLCNEEEEKKPEGKRRCPDTQEPANSGTKEEGTPLGCLPRLSLARMLSLRRFSSALPTVQVAQASLFSRRALSSSTEGGPAGDKQHSWKHRITRSLTDDQKTMAMAAGFAVVAFTMWKWQHDKPFARAYEATHCEEMSEAASEKVTVVEQLPKDFDLKTGAVKICLYQYESCPFCRKVRGVLDYHRLPYKLIEVHPLTKAETKAFAPDYKKVPLVTFEYNGRKVQMRNSSDIVAAVAGGMGTIAQPKKGVPLVKAPIPTELTKYMTGPEAVVPEKKSGEAEEVKSDAEMSIEEQWVRWADQCLVQLIVINIYRNLKESMETFDYLLTHKEFGYISKMAVYWSGTFVMMMVSGARRKKYHLPKGEEREALYEALDMMVEQMGDNSFLGGASPCTADFNVYGVLRSVEGFTTERLMWENTKIKSWYDRMAELVGPSMADTLVPRGPSVAGSVVITA
ncbi:Prostaglandin E synthase 2 [Perkinsus chesapeaki]|uniref:Prostaglandin E synthase 2 n=1 Tax=Perkinsus chesapeaki TaxID=330153 RepID=A0A7J6LEX3_PERCH|nr:Prostaglandin E synthase 2 [Perkinsus chesapeaki]